MRISITKNHVLSRIERGVYYFPLSNYPHITALELKNILAFIAYEATHGRQTEIICEDDKILAALNCAIANPETVNNISLPEKIIGCTSCLHHGCLTEFVYHATDCEAAQKILSGGKLLSAVKSYGKTGEELAYEKRNSLWNDPADFFEYIMFCWGNCVVGDYVVMSDDDNNESNEIFNPGVRFYFRYHDIVRHPGHVFDGYHCAKVKDEILLSDYLHLCIIPEQYKDDLEHLILTELATKVHYLPQNGFGIYDWSKKVYDFVDGTNNHD